jgi:small nuclear ribonucleoprotein (snRNP)-like protein
MKAITILSTALFLLVPASALADEPSPGAASAPAVSSARRSKLRNRVVVVEKQDGSLVTGKLVGGDDSSVELQEADGRRIVVDASTIKALRQKLRGYQVTVTMKGNDETIAGKLLERDPATIVVETDDGARVVLDRASVESVYERSPDAAAAGAGAAGPPPSTPPDPPEPPAGERPDAVRFRAGLSAGGGFAYVSTSSGSAVAPMVGFSGRLGVQFNHIFSVYYQNTGALPIASGATTFFDYNSLLADFTVGHIFDIGAGPSADVMTVSGSNGSASTTAVLPGLHARLALTPRGGAKGPGPHRSGLSVALDIHPTFGPGGVLLTMSPVVGYEWF